MEAWSRLRMVKAVRGFLGLIYYYQKFIRGYGVVAAPLTTLLKKEVFSWSLIAKQAFIELKRALIMASVLQMLDSTKWFVESLSRH